jgi:hypothetical protein
LSAATVAAAKGMVADDHGQRETPMIIADAAQFLEHVGVGAVFWYLRSQDGEYTLHGPHIVERFVAPGQDASMWQVLIWLVSVSDQRVFGAAQEDTAKLLQELTVIDDFFGNGGVVLTTEAEAEACYLGTKLQRGP